MALPEALSEDQVTAAIARASGQEGPGTNITRQLQAHLGMPATGSHDRATVVAVFTAQQARNVRGNPGVADPAYMGSFGLLFTLDVPAAAVASVHRRRPPPLSPPSS